MITSGKNIINISAQYKKLLFIGIGVYFIIASAGCYYDSYEYLFPQLGNDCDTTNITYSGTIKPILSSYCLFCHSNSTAASYGANIKLENYTDVLQRVNDNKLYGSISHAGGYSAMPKNSAKLNECKIISVKIWIDAGAPNN